MIKLLLVCCAVLIALLYSSCSNPSGTEPDNGFQSDFDVYLPAEGTVWQLWQTETLVTYDYLPIDDSFQINAEILKGDSLVTQFGNWFLNTGTRIFDEQVPDTFGMGDDYRLRLYTVEGDTAYSAQFTIEGYHLGGFSEIPAGSFSMGSEEGDWYHQPGESPFHIVTFSNSFEIMRTEVRQLTWKNVMNENPSNSYGDSLPVESVSWNDCVLFIETLSEMDPYYNYRLPSEAEWEYACRASTQTSFFWGDDNSPEAISPYGWYNPNSNGRTHEVGGLEPNNWGLYDIAGNVYEWCQDIHHENYVGAPSDGSAWVTGGNLGYRVQRGGSWSNNAQFLRSATRSKLGEDQWSISCGLRLVREPE